MAIHDFALMVITMCCHLVIMHHNLHTQLTQLGRYLVWGTARMMNFRTRVIAKNTTYFANIRHVVN